MQVTVENLSSVKKILHIEVPGDKVATELDNAYNSLKKTAKIKGFRPGKAPRSVLERLYKKNVNADVSSRLIQESLVDALKETDLKVLGSPQIDPPELKGQDPYKYKATVEVNPEIEDIDFKGLELKRTLYQITDEEIDIQLKMLQKNLIYHKDIEEDRPVRKGDFVLIDYEGFRDGKPFGETQKTENFMVKIGDGQILKDFDEKLIGMKPHDNREVTVKFPEDYSNQKLANLVINFQVTLKTLREEVVPEINDDLAKQLGKYETLDALQDSIKNNLEEGYNKRKEQELNEQIFQALIARKDFEVPDVLIESELSAIIEELERSFAYHQKSMEDAGFTRDALSEKYRDTAEKQVKRYLLLNKLIAQENFTLSDSDLEEGFNEMAGVFNQPVEEIKQYYDQNADKLEYFKHSLLEKQVIKLIINNSQIEDVASEKQADGT
ncbi:MAG: trigger factor [Deltaproteobacteria bacterium]|nr:trigger factor [Deltaproteobacteria bacterium]MBW2199433.1 trigger factor [Deltaproteobacteria bacterium]MBW2539232.1 trigger factor [Deltaproteobacteria bacterium]